MNPLAIVSQEVADASVGDIVRLDGKKYRLTKKTKTAVAVERYYWFDKAFDWLQKVGK